MFGRNRKEVILEEKVWKYKGLRGTALRAEAPILTSAVQLGQVFDEGIGGFDGVFQIGGAKYLVSHVRYSDGDGNEKEFSWSMIKGLGKPDSIKVELLERYSPRKEGGQ